MMTMNTFISLLLVIAALTQVDAGGKMYGKGKGKGMNSYKGKGKGKGHCKFDILPFGSRLHALSK